MPVVSAEDLTRLCKAIFLAVDTPDDIAQAVAESLILSNLLGHDSHGIALTPRYTNRIRNKEMFADARPEIQSQMGAVAIVNCKRGFGQIGARFGIELAGDMAQKLGISCVALNEVNHIGRVGEYAERLASQGLIGMVMCGGAGKGGSVAPFGGRERMFGTNPMAWAVPVKKSHAPLVVDFATSNIAAGKLDVLLSKGETAPPGALQDPAGNPSTDPASFYDGGALLPFGGHKGYGLMLMVEILANILPGFAPVASDEYKMGNPTLIMAWSVDAFTSAERFEALVDELLQKIKNSSPAQGYDEVLLPGEPEARSHAQRSHEGIPIPDSLWSQLNQLSEDLGVKL